MRVKIILLFLFSGFVSGIFDDDPASENDHPKRGRRNAEKERSRLAGQFQLFFFLLFFISKNLNEISNCNWIK